MKAVTCLFFLLLASIVQAQTVIVSPQDVEISWNQADWSAAQVVSVAYSAEPVRPEQKIGRPGMQTWECLMCDSTQASPRKAIIVVNIPSPPSAQDRTLYLRMRNRYSDDSEIGPWSEAGSVKVTGKPQNVE